MKVITAPEFLEDGRSLFIAGGITGVKNWQLDLLNLLKELDIIVYNPRREFAPENVEEQIFWEYSALRIADSISFWFSNETVQPITLFELGRWAGTHKPMFVGVHPEYARRKDVEIQLKFQRPDIEIVYNLEDLAKQIKEWVMSVRD